MTPANQEAYAKARARVRHKTLLYSHIAVYVVGILALFVVNATADPDAQRGNWWVIYPAAAWGGVVLVHAALLWSGVLPGGRGRLAHWEDRRARELMACDNQHTAV